MIFVAPQPVERRLAAAAMFVRAHLDERILLEDIARVAGFSPFHFHRIFRVAFGENVSAYVSRHRLQRAAHELRYTTRSITEIGLHCGYESPSAFGRAFARAFDRTPSAYREFGGAEPLVPAGFIARDAGVPEPRIEEYAEREALALRHVGPYDELDPVMERLYGIARRRGFLPEARILGVSHDSPDMADHASLRFDACVTVVAGADVAGARSDGARLLTIPGGRYAVFRHRGAYQRITHGYDLLVAAWVLTGRVELRDAPFVNTYYSNPSVVRESELECDLAIPVV
jgi:AraC family transcriptional regulator